MSDWWSQIFGDDAARIAQQVPFTPLPSGRYEFVRAILEPDRIITSIEELLASTSSQPTVCAVEVIWKNQTITLGTGIIMNPGDDEFVNVKLRHITQDLTGTIRLFPEGKLWVTVF